MKRLALIVIALAFCCFDAEAQSWQVAKKRAMMGGDTHFTITFLTGTIPTNIVLGTSYTGPISSTAMYDAGDGVWRGYSANNLPVVGTAVRFSGDWRTSLGTYSSMFYDSLTSTTFTCKFSGSFKNYPTHLNAYYQMFRNCTRVTSIAQNPIPNLVGTPAANMFSQTCYNMSGVTGSLPTGFMDTSGLTGSPASFMFSSACYNMSGVTGSLPTGFMDTSKLTGSPASYMFSSACYNMSKVTSLPENFLNTSGLTGFPSVQMFYFACYNMSGVTSGDIYLGSNITFTSSNIVGTTNALYQTCYQMRKWNGNVYWGTNLIVNAIPIPDSSSQAFYNCTNMPNYSIIDANWK